MKLFYRLSLSVLFSSVTIISFAASNPFPRGCQQAGFAFKHYALILHPEAAGRAQSIYFIHNKGRETIKFYQARTGDEPFRIHLNSSLKPDRWAIFAANNDITKFICAVPSRNSTYGDVVNCKHYIELCEYTNAKFGDNGYGNYWMVTDQSRTSAQRTATRQGVLLKW